ncbi:hypothetical protein A2738_03155 [Candidatus Nomurabacteria bacterium RIFCSPHIGHO2_01_FULL_42_15]|uniref:Uncharacterized protein n=1 Tax=Candidatus Nomurabacteria bacterium RIFCSPHIGHO2_01_FULL_42_15 TaxID=1801742 RepID=A0A1F6VE20_9BACT|nr:MAG: hypothetical protein A2738_03155 [Candidatus Nomurabacteria bacterium RIFCSPHIGHO2_01_FULL_42_15]OGI92946.1 MAG: hypothetical protein A3A99_00160 [Candidatus Nomurabacteria bacterium RIFCSPLOWO2_01_FULL_41_18]
MNETQPEATERKLRKRLTLKGKLIFGSIVGLGAVILLGCIMLMTDWGHRTLASICTSFDDTTTVAPVLTDEEEAVTVCEQDNKTAVVVTPPRRSDVATFSNELQAITKLLVASNARMERSENVMSNNLAKTSCELRKLVSEATTSMSDNLARTTGELNAIVGLVSSNQVLLSARMRDLGSEMAADNAAIRAEIPDLVNVIVTEKLLQAMEPFRRLLTLTNVPPAPVVPCPAAVTKATATPTAIAGTSPSGVTNNNLLVVNNVLPAQSAARAYTSPAQGLVIHNNNTLVVHDRQLPPHPPGEKPYWMRDLFPPPK